MRSAYDSLGTARTVAGLPSGTVTFLFSDIEGSTQRWDRYRAAMQAAVRQHDGLMRAAIGQHDGRVFKTIGDAFCAVFARAEDALAAAFDAQSALAATDFSAVGGLRVRMALHTGTADERDDDYFGSAVNRVARLLAIGYGGQVLLSGVTADLVLEDLPPQAGLHGLGTHLLKDLARPEQVYQLIAPEMQRDFPALRSLNVLANNLPPQLTSFVGRESEIAGITAMIKPRRVVTVIGSGGVGKTRIALQVAANLVDGNGDGVWFVELAPLADSALVPATIASVLRVTLPNSGESLPALVVALARRHCLVILDNCEHVVEGAAAAVSAILRNCPGVAILATSRQALGVAGEEIYRLPSLSLPSEIDAAALKAADAIAYSAVALFTERGHSADQRFTLTDETAPIVAEICRRLDGVAFAIELAAARVGILPPRELRARLDQRFRVLTGGSRDTLPRQRTLRALIDWSYDLLDERERQLFRRLGIFVDSFSLEGAVAVGRDDTIDEFDVFNLLASLVDKSLIVAELSDETARYRMLQSTRAYASEKLEDAGERDHVAERHVRYLRDLFVRTGAQYESRPRDADVLALASELDDARAALEWAAANGRAELGAELLVSTDLWLHLSLAPEALAHVARYAQLVDPSDILLRARLLQHLAHIHNGYLMSSGSAQNAALEALALARAANDTRLVAKVLCECAEISISLGRFFEAQVRFDEAEATGSRPGGVGRAILAFHEGNYETAARLFEEVRAQNRSLGNDEARDLLYLSELAHARHETALAISYTRDALRPGRPQTWARSYLFANLVGYLLALDALEESREAGRSALKFLQKIHPDGVHIAQTIEHIALLSALAGDARNAARLEGFADAQMQRNGAHRTFTETTTHERLSAVLQAQLDASTLDSLLAEGATWSCEVAIAEALRVTKADVGRTAG